jgi:hypothetical protein
LGAAAAAAAGAGRKLARLGQLFNRRLVSPEIARALTFSGDRISRTVACVTSAIVPSLPVSRPVRS